MEPIDHIGLPEMEGDCEVPHRQESILSAPVPLITGLVEDYIYKVLSEMEHVSTDYLYTTGGENQNKYSVLFNYETMDSLSEWMEEAFLGIALAAYQVMAINTFVLSFIHTYNLDLF